ncbi:MAG: TetR/AcrR family transcriptional regulator [Polyangiaceae bacterium]|nr:TetR/AcrR family transcriptional regulator [Polyangiaceae bacterium]
MGTAERREREKLALQQKIIDKGREILVNEGPAALTMRRLADEIEYTAGALYAHFADKEKLVRAICQTDFEAFTSQFSSAMAEKDPLKRLRLLAKLYARFALEHPAQYKILFVLDSVGGVEKERGNPEKDAYAIVELAVEAAMKEGHFKAFEGRTQLVAQSLWAAMHGVVSIEIRRVDDMQIPFELIDDRVDVMCEVMLAGLDALETSAVLSAPAAGVKKQSPARKAPARVVAKRRPAEGRKHT